MLQHPAWGNRFHRYMTLATTTAAFVPEGKLLSLLGVKDATEEWDTLHHVPTLLERDIYTLLGAQVYRNGRLSPALTGLMVCLGDGIKKQEWSWLFERFNAAAYTNPAKSLAPILYWSNAAFDTFLPEYIATRRWSTHKFLYEMELEGALFGAIATAESLASASGSLFVPNMDLLPPEEIQALAAYKGGSVTATAARGFKPEAFGIKPQCLFTDKWAGFPLTAFAFNCSIAEPDAICAINDEKDDAEDLDMANVKEFDWTLVDTLQFRKVSIGFRKACAALIKAAGDHTFSCNLPIMPILLENGNYRLYILNEAINSYGFADVSADRLVKNVSIVSKYPVLPVKFKAKGVVVGVLARDSTGVETDFRAKVTPGGVTILEITL